MKLKPGQLLIYKNGFIITATIIDLEGNRLALAEITDIQEQFSQAVGGPVVVRATFIPGAMLDYAGFILRRELEDRYKGQLAERGAQVADMTVEEGEAGLAIMASATSFEENGVTDAALAGIQADLSETMAAPVNIQAAILPARQVNVGSPSSTQPNAGKD